MMKWRVDPEWDRPDPRRVELTVSWPNGERRVFTHRIFGGDEQAAKDGCLRAAAKFEDGK
jgi:hypothetical protein